MPNDSPDWANTVATPAIDLGTFTVPANTIATVYNGPTPPGCHSLKVFVESTDPSSNAQQVTVIDPATVHTMEQFLIVQGTEVIAQVDDICTPNIRVDVFAAFTQATTGRVVAYLSDQAVWVDNDNNSPIPVRLVGIGPTSPPTVTTLPVEIAPQGLTKMGISAVNAPQTVPIPAPPAGQFNRLSQVVVGYSGQTAGAPSLQIQDSNGVTVWQAFVFNFTGAANLGVPQTFTFPIPLVVTSGTGAINLVVSASGAAGIASICSAVYAVY